MHRDAFTCADCGVVGAEHRTARGFVYAVGDPSLCRWLTIDHVIPTSRGGTDDESNLEVRCNPCNARKSDRMAA